jgi:predicted RNA binding protein YcfA (HicA-like mRNA interferase family)
MRSAGWKRGAQRNRPLAGRGHLIDHGHRDCPIMVRRAGPVPHDIRVKVRDAIQLVERDGWALVNVEGSHRQYKHPAKKGRVTIAGHPSMDLDPKTQRSILKQAGLK